MRVLLLIVIASCISALGLGCAASRHRTALGPALIPPDFRREHDAAFSKSEQEMIAAARKFIEKSDQRPVDGYYKIQHTQEGYSVLVLLVIGYDGDEPQFRPGGDRTVVLREDASLIRIEGGL